MNNTEIDKIVNTTDEEISQMSFKEKQEYFKKRNKLCKIIYVSRDKKGKGNTYIKKNQDQDISIDIKIPEAIKE